MTKQLNMKVLLSSTELDSNGEVFSHLTLAGADPEHPGSVFELRERGAAAADHAAAGQIIPVTLGDPLP